MPPRRSNTRTSCGERVAATAALSEVRRVRAWEEAHVLRALLAMPRSLWDLTWAGHVTTELETTTRMPVRLANEVSAQLLRLDGCTA